MRMKSKKLHQKIQNYLYIDLNNKGESFRNFNHYF